MRLAEQKRVAELQKQRKEEVEKQRLIQEAQSKLETEQKILERQQLQAREENSGISLDGLLDRW